MKLSAHTNDTSACAQKSGNLVGPSSGPAQELDQLARQLTGFHSRFSSFFITQTRSVLELSRKYLNGLIQSEKKNMERMAEVVPNSNDQAFQHFMSKSPWDHKAVMEQVALDVDAAIGGSENCFLIIDESGFDKKGVKSVGVARQWNGRLGKVDNCQVGVFAAMGCGDEVSLINERLYLPKEWTNDKKRCEEAGIPDNERGFRTKSELALEMVLEASRQGLRYNWVGLDGGYGKDCRLLRALDRENKIWVADVHCNQVVYLEDPEPKITVRRNKKGEESSRLVAQTPPVRVDKWTVAQSEADWKKVILRESTKGTLTVEILHQRVWLWDGKEPSAHCWHLVVRREIDTPEEIKYCLSNAEEGTTAERISYQQAQRFWVEQALRNGKSEAGLGDYQLRGWTGWHHHMAMVMMAMLFMFEVRREHKHERSLLSCHDIVEILRVLLPRANVTYKDIIRQLEERHRRRQASIDSEYRRQQDRQQYKGP